MRRTTYVCVCICVLAPRGCRESVFQKARCRLTPTPPAKRVCFSNVRSWWESEAALRRGYDCFPRKMEWRQRKKGGEGEHKRRWWLLSIISLAHSTDRGNSAALSFCWSIPPFWEDGQHNALSISPTMYPFLSIFSLFFFYLSVCHLVPIMFSQIIAFLLQIILEVKSFANEQILIKS